MNDRPLVSVIVLNYNGKKYLHECLRSIMASAYQPLEIIVVDNGSTDGSVDNIEDDFGGIRVIRNGANLGFSGGCNRGIEQANGQIILLANMDTTFERNCISALVEQILQDGKVAICGAKLFFADGRTLQHAGGDLSANALSSHRRFEALDDPDGDNTVEPCDYVTAAVMAIRADFLQLVGGLDEDYPFYFEDNDLCAKAWMLGYKVLYVGAARAIHYHRAGTHDNDFDYDCRYHLGRMIYVAKIFSPRRVLCQFLPAECRWLFSGASRTHRVAVILAYLRVLPIILRLVLLRCVRGTRWRL